MTITPGTTYTLTLADGETCRARVQYLTDPCWSVLAGAEVTCVGLVDVNDGGTFRVTLDELHAAIAWAAELEDRQRQYDEEDRIHYERFCDEWTENGQGY